MDALTEARFDDVLRNRLEALYATLPQGPVHTRLTDVVEQAHHEYRKRGRPGVT
ncbi:hypothetical protein [Actinophytocola algeriensis]|uniref:Uncharacterized protein n=1 Tax=Actinophytocola algeriensis TaxID=1768010 RepID=A0A7W7QEM9_9PSEU|nr:hypothetical protein [Actinophytocola algeriensis]MBB4912230.1 hypothetical protein [Actinophytocola algeriensis]MBE1474254.1 hypothetical protein [Actinophytocola algeriensis]